jgi:hypothetical protein
MGILQLKNIVFCTDFTMNLVLLRLLQERGHYENNKGMNNYLVKHNHSIIYIIEEIYG